MTTALVEVASPPAREGYIEPYLPVMPGEAEAWQNEENAERVAATTEKVWLHRRDTYVIYYLRKMYVVKVLPWERFPEPGGENPKKHVVYAGLDDRGVLHLRVFNSKGEMVADAAEDSMPRGTDYAIKKLKSEIATTGSNQRHEVIKLTRAILGRNIPDPDDTFPMSRTVSEKTVEENRDREWGEPDIFPVNRELLKKHAKGELTIANRMPNADDTCINMVLDVDRHKDDDDPDANWRFVKAKYDALRASGCKYVRLADSNGKGGWHLSLCLRRLVPALWVRALGLYLASDWESYGLGAEPEVNPKTHTVNEGGEIKQGSAIRSPGKHHTREHWTRFWDGERILWGQDAIDHYTALENAEGDEIPFKDEIEAGGWLEKAAQSPAKRARGERPPVPRVKDRLERSKLPSYGGKEYAAGEEDREFLKGIKGDLTWFNIIAACREKGLDCRYLGEGRWEVACINAGEHSTGGDVFYIREAVEDCFWPDCWCPHNHCDHLKGSIMPVLKFLGAELIDKHCKYEWQPFSHTNAYVAARKFLGKQGGIYAYDDKGWHKFDGKKYLAVGERIVRKPLWEMLDKKAKAKPTRHHVSDIIDPLKGWAGVPEGREKPCWLADAERAAAAWGGFLPDPCTVINVGNGLVDFNEFTPSGKVPKLRPHSPKFFSDRFLDINYDPTAKCPLWEAFLLDCFSDDEERVWAMQLFMGYLLSLETEEQKYVIQKGLPRSGKGVTGLVTGFLMSWAGVARPSLSSLDSPHVLASLVGKSTAIMNEAKSGKNTDMALVYERLISIVGGDPQDVNPKHLPHVSDVKLPTRFIIGVNEVPKFSDPQGAMYSRTIIIPYDRSYTDENAEENAKRGKEKDKKLFKKFLGEMNGIFNWMGRGLQDYRREGKLIQPSAGEEDRQSFRVLWSPIHDYIQQRCNRGDDLKVPKEVLYADYRRWCKKNGQPENTIIGAQMFGQRLTDMGMKTFRPREGGKQVAHYVGIDLKSRSTELTF